MSYRASRDIWLESFQGRVALSNVVTQRRVLLSPDELSILNHFAGTSLESDLPEQWFHRLKEADLLVESDKANTASKVGLSLTKAVDRYLAESLGLSRRKVVEREPDVFQRLTICEELGLKSLTSSDLESSRDFRSLIRTVRAFLMEEVDQPSGFSYGVEFLKRVWQRPSLEFLYGQLPCMPETTQRRVRLAHDLESPGRRCLVLGDDDLVGLYWCLSSREQCEVFELDERLLYFLEQQKLDNLRLLQRDLTQGLPKEFHGRYQAIFTDPMYGRQGMDMFLLCCSQGIGSQENARIFLTTRPDLIEDGEQLSDRLSQVGLRIDKVRQNFSRYRMPEETRTMALQSLSQSGVSLRLLRGLLQVPYYYADMLEVSKIA